MTAQPLSGPNGLSNGIGRIDAATGAQSFINVESNAAFVTLNGVAVNPLTGQLYAIVDQG
jgi:hypothetical protein